MKKFMSVAVLLSVLLGACSEEVMKEDNKAVEQKEEKKAEPKKSDAQIKKEKEEKAEEAVAEKERADSKRYADEISASMRNLGGSLKEFSKQNAKVGENPYVMSTETWIMDTVVALTKFEASVQDVKNVKEPINQTLKESHDLVMSAMDEYQFAIDNYPDAVDNMDTELLNECIFAINRATEYTKKATDLAVKFMEDGGK